MAVEHKQEKQPHSESPQLGRYRHFKGGEYEVIGVGLDSDERQPMVVYVDQAGGQWWVRRQAEFMEQVTVDGKEQPRFEFLAPAPESDFEGRYKRALADYHNLLKQQAREKEEFVRFALAGFLEDLLPIYDHLKLSLKGVSATDASSAWAQGVGHVLKQFKELLAERGVEEIKTVGERFDHDAMEAIGGQGELVEQEVMPGYKLNGKLIRPAKVIVREEQAEDLENK